MASVAQTTERLREQANELYWKSSETVEQLANRLGMSRNAVYSSVRPVPAGAVCEQCNEPLVFTNRSNRAARVATCPSCERQVTLPEQTGAALDALGAELGDGVSPVPQPRKRWERLKEDIAAVPPERAAKIGGAAAIGAALGAAAVKAIRKRT